MNEGIGKTKKPIKELSYRANLPRLLIAHHIGHIVSKGVVQSQGRVRVVGKVLFHHLNDLAHGDNSESGRDFQQG